MGYDLIYYIHLRNYNTMVKPKKGVLNGKEWNPHENEGSILYEG